MRVFVNVLENGKTVGKLESTDARCISTSVRALGDDGWLKTDARRFRITGISSFHVYFVRPDDRTQTATLVFWLPGRSYRSESTEDVRTIARW